MVTMDEVLKLAGGDASGRVQRRNNFVQHTLYEVIRKNMAIYVNKLLKSGVLDPEWATTTPEDYERKIVEGNTFIMYDWSPNIVRYNLQGTQNNPEYNVEPIYSYNFV